MTRQYDFNSGDGTDSLDELLAWLKQKAGMIEYGEVGLILTKHQGRITQYKKIENISGKLDSPGK